MISLTTKIDYSLTKIRHLELLETGLHCIIDAFCYISTKVILKDFVHIASNCTIAGGQESIFKCGSFGGLASGVRVFCVSDDFINDIATVLPTFLYPQLEQVKTNLIKGDVELGDFCTIGSNSIVMPNVRIPEGTCVGAMSFVPSNVQLEPWSIYSSRHGRLIKVANRNKENVLRQVEKIKEETSKY